MKQITSNLTFLLLTCIYALADVVILKHGQVITGTVLQNDEKGVLVQFDYGTMTYPKSLVKEIKTDATEPASTPTSTRAEQRVPNWALIIERLAKKPWAVPLRQIPATVIEKGIFKNIPYISFSCGYGYEMNIYGDLDNPAGVEIGLSPKLLTYDPSKSNCIEFIASMLCNNEDKEVVRKLNLKQDFTTRNGLQFEITPPTAEDAYGGWWISVYQENLLDQSRATDAEMKEITQNKTLAAPEPESPRPQLVYQPLQASDAPSANPANWSASDLRTSVPIRNYSNSFSGSSGGSVYVRGYTRKDGTYVRTHTRRAPRR